MMSRTRAIAVLAVSVILGIPGAAEESAGKASQAAGQPYAEIPTGPPSPREIETRSEVSLAAVFVDVDGSRDKFLSDRYLRSGFNVGNALFEFRPVEGAETFFNFARLSAAGFGDSSPFQHADLRIGKRRLYDLQAGYKKYNHFFALPDFAFGLHSENSAGRSANLSLKLFPDRKASFEIGYRRSQLYGTVFSTQDLILDAYPVSYPRRLASDEFSLGTTLKFKPVSLTFEQSLIRFRDDAQLFPNGLLPSGLRGNVLDSGQRDTPTRIFTPMSRAVIRYRPGGRFDAVGSYAYSNGDVKLTRFDNLLNLTGPFGFPVRQIISSSGVSDKPTHTADVSETVRVTNQLTAHHHFHYDTYTLSGILDTFGVLQFLSEREGAQVDLPVEQTGGTVTEYLLARNEIDLEYSVSRSVSLLGGYRYSDRHVAFGDRQATPRRVVTITHAGNGGIVWIPSAKGRFRAEFEKGVSSSAYTRIDPLSFLRWKVRGQFRPVPRVTISANMTLADNRNDTAGVNYDLDDRQVSMQVAYVPSDRLFFSGGYNLYRIRTTTDIVFFALSQLSRGHSLYESNTHLAHVQFQSPVGRRVDIRVGYELIKDTGQSFPLRLHTPRAGLSCLLRKGIYLEVDWRHYSYNERALALQDYRANVLATGLRFGF